MPGEAVGQVLAQVESLLTRRRHADAVRLLRASAGVARRRAWAQGECACWLAAARIVRHRGRVHEAEDALRHAFAASESTASGQGFVECAFEMAWVCFDDGRLTECVEWLARADEGRDEDGPGDRRDRVGWLNALVALWDGRPDDAASWVAAFGRRADHASRADYVAERACWTSSPAEASVEVALLTPPGALAVERVVRARLAERGRDCNWVHAEPPRCGDRRGDGLSGLDAVATCEADLLLAIAREDESTARTVLSAGLAAAARAHAPLPGLALRLAAAERWPASWATLGVWAPTRRLTASLPGLYRRRVLAQLASSLAGGGSTVVATDATRSAPIGDAVLAGSLAPESLAVRILDIINHAPDEQTALDRVCAWLHDTARVAHASIWVSVGGMRPVASAGGPCNAGIAARLGAATARLAAGGCQQTPDGELLAPVRYDGRLAGVLVLRGGSDSRAPHVLEADAAVVASATAWPVRVVADRLAVATTAGVSPIVGNSAAAEMLRRQVAQAAATPFPVLIEGESGTGKELAARAIHAASDRRGRRFCAVNCAALTDELLEAELFGHIRGAFTGAMTDRAGLFEDADGGTLFLDEVVELSARAQAKLLRVLQEGEIRRVGENHTRTVDVRVIAATNRPLAGEVAAGRFREDLRYRLDVIRIETPALRARPEDVPVLAETFWRQTQARTGTRAVLSADLCAELARRPWPGNVRELQNTLAALAARAPRSGRISRLDLGDGQPDGRPRNSRPRLHAARVDFERTFVREALLRFGGRRGQVAAELGVTRQGLAKLVARLGLDEGLPSTSVAGETGPFRRP